MSTSDEIQTDVVVLGAHPAAYLAAALMGEYSPAIKVIHSTLAHAAQPDRLVLVNPAFFELHEMLKPLKRTLDLKSVFGVRFLSDDPKTRSEHVGKSGMVFVARYGELRQGVMDIAAQRGVTLLNPDRVRIRSLDEAGVDLTLGEQRCRAKALIVGEALEQPLAKTLGLDAAWDREVVYRYSFVKPERSWRMDFGAKPMISMSLDLQQSLNWAWLLPHGEIGQACVMQPVNGTRERPLELMRHWTKVLRGHGILGEEARDLVEEDIVSVDLPLAGALAHEGVGNRTLVIGPAGGFFSACAEDVYPNCWSALFAVEVMRGALGEKHLQDALQAYPQQWRTTLGEYLRGPQQNLRFLLPMIYRNQAMASRLAEAILLGASIVR